MLRALRIKLYPNATQVDYLARLFGCCRKIYNLALDESERLYKETGKGLTSRADLVNHMHRVLLKDPELSYLKEHNTKILKCMMNNLADGYSNFFKSMSGQRKGPKMGLPEHKRRSNRQSVTVCREALAKMAFHEHGKLFISKTFGKLTYRCSDQYHHLIAKHADEVRSVTLVRNPSGSYYASVLVDCELLRKPKATDHAVGVDLGVKTLMVTSDGELTENSHPFRRKERRLRLRQRWTSRKVKGSKNRGKARVRLAKTWEKVNDYKRSRIHGLTWRLIDDNQVICIEDLNVKGMMRNHKLAKSLSEVNFGECRRLLEYKALWYGRELSVIDRWYPSSKTCSVCGYRYEGLTLNEREWTCPECGTAHDRDVNAARNILAEGLRILGGRSAKVTPVETQPTCGVEIPGAPRRGSRKKLHGATI